MQTCDILIVGGGVMGVSIAYALGRRRVGRVVLLEKSFLGAGSSGKSGAIIRQHYSNRLTASMAQKSLRVFEHFEDVVGGPPVFTHTGMVLVVNERDRAMGGTAWPRSRHPVACAGLPNPGCPLSPSHRFRPPRPGVWRFRAGPVLQADAWGNAARRQHRGRGDQQSRGSKRL